jgi:hypothetical protein
MVVTISRKRLCTVELAAQRPDLETSLMPDSADEIQSHMAPVPKIFTFRSTDRGLRLNVDDLLKIGSEVDL